MATEKKLQSPVGACLKKLISVPAFPLKQSLVAGLAIQY